MYIFANNVFRQSIIFDFQTLISKWTELLIKKICVIKIGGCSFKNTFSVPISIDYSADIGVLADCSCECSDFLLILIVGENFTMKY